MYASSAATYGLGELGYVDSHEIVKEIYNLFLSEREAIIIIEVGLKPSSSIPTFFNPCVHLHEMGVFVRP